MTPLQLGQEATFPVTVEDGNGNPRPAAVVAATTDYSKGYVKFVGNLLHVVSKALGAFSVTINGHTTDDGTTLATKTEDFTVIAPPHVVDGTPSVGNISIVTPGDPGVGSDSATV
jgi:hypothetical protein